MTRLSRISLVFLGVQAVLGATPVLSAPFTGPTSQYYLNGYGDGFANGSIQVVQGTNTVNSFPWAGSCSTQYCQGNLAVTNVVSTNWFGPGYGPPDTARQYTLTGTPTGTTWTGTPLPLGESFSAFYDGTSDGIRNYTVEYYGIDGVGFTENVIATDLNWQNPVVLFSAQTAVDATTEWLGITYDPTNNSLWLGGWGSGIISEYSLTGIPLSSFAVATPAVAALAFDPADNTLWYSDFGTNNLYQYSRSGTLLQSGTPSGLVQDGAFLAGEFAEGVAAAVVPEPATFALFVTGLLGLGALRRKRKTAA